MAMSLPVPTPANDPALLWRALFPRRRPESLAAAAGSVDESADLAVCRASLAQGSRTFLAASLLLPKRVHEPACALYAFCRLADDAVDEDGGGMPGGRAGAVIALRERIRLAYAGRPLDDAADRALAAVVARHRIPQSLFDALLEGFEWDLHGRRYATIDALHAYAARVAGSVGAMMALLMGARSPDALARACDLGVAMQLSNIARDVGEDARLGRLYLPSDWLVEAGIEPNAWLADPVASPALASVVQRLLDEAGSLYRRVDGGVARLPVACRPGINAARFLYAEIGHEVARRGFDSVNSRARVPRWRKAMLLARSVAAFAPSARGPALPPLDANRFLVEAAADSEAPSAPRRGVGDRVGWALELFASLEQRECRVVAPRLGRLEVQPVTA